MSNSNPSNASPAHASSLEGIPIWNPDEEAKLNALLTARKKAAASLGLGASETLFMALERLGWDHSLNDSEEDQRSAKRRFKIQSRTPVIDLRSGTSPTGLSLKPGATSRASTYTEPLEQANPQPSTMLSDTNLCTLLQVKRLYGSITIPDNLYSSLTSLRARLSEKRSCESWMAILAKFRSKATMSQLDGLLSCFVPTTTTTQASIQLSDDDSTEADSSQSTDGEEILHTSESLSASEELSGEEEDYRYSKMIRDQAREAWRKSTPKEDWEEEESSMEYHSDQ